ncbi:hypothetical protein LXA43DRAFT_198565 [Ganoderma leucocontextum]|nr:hypothetical protein LXA43DRAFT_198565 [Ganoderma leucocontextum]
MVEASKYSIGTLQCVCRLHCILLSRTAQKVENYCQRRVHNSHVAVVPRAPYGNIRYLVVSDAATRVNGVFCIPLSISTSWDGTPPHIPVDQLHGDESSTLSSLSVEAHPAMSATALDSLPNEILIQIFLHHNGLRSEHESIPRCAYACDGVELMLVCRHWRELAVSTPCLWQATKVPRNAVWFKLVLSRSEDLPLDLVFHQTASSLSISDCVVLLLSHTHRLRSMFIPAIQVVRSALDAIFHLSMPLLSDLDVLVKSGGGLDLSPERLPALRSLRLSSCTIPWIPTMLPKLRRKDLQECTCRDSSATFEQLLGVLSECVELRELRLHHFFSALRQGLWTTEGNHGPSISISFPHLRELSVHDRPNLLSRFLSCVRLGAHTDIHIVGHILDATMDTADAFLSLLPQDTSALPLLRLVKFGEIQNWYDSCELVGHMGWCVAGPKITLGLQLGPLPTWSFYLESALREFSVIFSGAPIDRLHVVGEYKHVRHFDAWVRLFTAFPTVQHLELDGDHSPLPVIGALGQPPYDESGLDANSTGATTEADGMDGAGVGAIILPRLRCLDIGCLDWCPGLVETMVTVLQRRAMSGLPKLDNLWLSMKTMDKRAYRRTMEVYRASLASLVEELEDILQD